MYSIALNRAYLHRIINILAVVTNRQFPWSCFQRHTPLSPADAERVCLCCSWCLVRAHGTRMVIFWGWLTGLNNPSSLHQPVETFYPVCKIYPLNHLLKIPPGTSVSNKKGYIFLQRSAGSDQGLLVFPVLTGSVTTLWILCPVALLMRQVCPALRQDQLLALAPGLVKPPKSMWWALQQYLTPHCIPGKGLGRKMTGEASS